MPTCNFSDVRPSPMRDLQGQSADANVTALEDPWTIKMLEEHENETADWINARLGCVLGVDGRGGTGTFIELQNGELALLTARHVVVGCLLGGGLTASRFNPKVKGPPGDETVMPTKIWIDNRRDAALLEFDSGVLDGDAIHTSEMAGADESIVAGMPVVVSGIVGEWKEPDTVNRVIPQVRALNLGTFVTEPRDCEDFIVCDAREPSETLPISFRGMSGGPVVSLGHKLLGINTKERRMTSRSPRATLATRLSDLGNLLQRFKLPANSFTDYMRQTVGGKFRVVSSTDTKRIVPLSIEAEFFWSRGDPDSQDGRIGRIVAITFGVVIDEVERCYRVNCQSTFTWFDGNTEEERLRALNEESVFFIESTGFELVPNP